MDALLDFSGQVVLITGAGQWWPLVIARSCQPRSKPRSFRH